MNIDIVGTGFVGLTLGIALSNAGLKVTCWDIDIEKIRKLRNGITDIKEPSIKKYLEDNQKKNLLSFKGMRESQLGEFVVVSVGTQLIENSSESSTSNLYKIIEKLSKNVNVKFIVLRCTVSVGVTRILHERWGDTIDFIYAPERTIEGNAINELKELPQIIACSNDISKAKAELCFSSLKVPLLFTNSWEEAELAKLLCNVYRDYNFAFANQAALLCRKLSIDVSSVSKLASTNYSRFNQLKPGPVSGPCLTKDTIILSESFEKKKDIELYINARKLNYEIEEFILRDIFSIAKKFNSNKILMNGLSFKSNPPVGDTRDSHAVRIAKEIIKAGYEFYYFDDLVDDAGREFFKDYKFNENISDIDILIFPIIPHWYPNENIVLSKFKNKPRYWFYKPDIILDVGSDYFFGDYNNNELHFC